MNARDTKKVRIAIAWTLLGVTLLYLLSGFAITYPGIVGPLTAGILGKALAFRVHELLWIPFVLLLVLHVAINVGRRAGLLKRAGP